MKEIPLTFDQVALVDDSDLEWLLGYSWYAVWDKRCYYARANYEGINVSMHRVVMNADETQQVDHVNGITLDNQRSNLRFATNAQNCRNSGPRNGKKYKGVYQLPSGRFAAKLWVAPKLRHLGVFDLMEDAARCADEAALAEFGEFAFTNFPREEY